MDYYSTKITALIEELSRLPGIGPKSAGRLAFHLLNLPEADVNRLTGAIHLHLIPGVINIKLVGVTPDVKDLRRLGL